MSKKTTTVEEEEPVHHKAAHHEEEPMVKAEPSAWKDGPLPPDTWGWGAVVPHDSVMPHMKFSETQDFMYADFCGDHVLVMYSESTINLKPHEVRKYNNSITLPPP